MKAVPLPLPDFFDPNRVNLVWKVPYQERAQQARQWAREHNLNPAPKDTSRIWLLLVDVQNTFCIPDYELFVGGRNGRAAVEDNIRLCEFIYRNLAAISHITTTLDSHTAMQVFHPLFFIDKNGAHPKPYTDVQAQELRRKRWQFNPAIAPHYGIAPEYGQQMLIHYAEELERKGKYALTVWPYHAMLGGIGHALVSAVGEAIFFHTIARLDQSDFEVKGEQPFTEHYSVVGPEVLTGPMGEQLGSRNPKFLAQIQEFDQVIIAGQAKSHCVAWTISDLLEDIRETDPALAGRVYLLEDCTSPVVVPGVVDHTEAAEKAFARFAQAGMHIVRSTDDFLR